MLQAIDRNKAGRNFSGSEVYWKALFSKSEDSLTSSVLGSLFYLPNELFWRILNNAIEDNTLPKGSHSITAIDFWPSWNADETRNAIRVEPDVFISTESFDLIIEVKTDASGHTYEQWKDQCQAYYNEYGNQSRLLYYIALGGFVPTNNRSISIGEHTIHVMECKWQSLLEQVKRSYDSLNSLQDVLFSVGSVQRILKDAILAFPIHGHFAIQWLETIPSLPYVGLNESSKDFFNKLQFHEETIDASYLNITENSINLFTTTSYE